jgi:hypothetical protein
MTLLLPPYYYRFSIPLIMEFTAGEGGETHSVCGVFLLLTSKHTPQLLVDPMIRQTLDGW